MIVLKRQFVDLEAELFPAHLIGEAGFLAMTLASATLAGTTDWEPAINPASSKIRMSESSSGLANR